MDEPPAVRICRAPRAASSAPPSAGSGVQSTRLSVFNYEINVHSAGEESKHRVLWGDGGTVREALISVPDRAESVAPKGEAGLLKVDACSEQDGLFSETFRRAFGDDQSGAQIESVKSWGAAVGATNSCGKAVVCFWEPGADSMRTSELEPERGSLEAGWCGLDLTAATEDSSSSNSICNTQAAVCSMLDRWVSVYDLERGTATVTFGTPENPTALQFAPAGMMSGGPGNVCFVAEWSSFCARDLRAPSNDTIVRWSSGNQPLYTITAHCGSGRVAVSGANRALHVLESRKWNALGAWNGCAKYEVTAASFIDEDSVVVAGMDASLSCGRWRIPSTALSALGDGRWLGLAPVITSPPSSNARAGAHFIGLSDTGSFYSAHFTQVA